MTNATYFSMAPRSHKAALVAAFILACSSVTRAQAGAESYADCDAKAKTISYLEDCAGAERDRAYSTLDAAYKKLLAKMTPQGEQKLKAARDAWENYSKKQCEFNTAGLEDAREHPNMKSAMMLRPKGTDDAYVGPFLMSAHCMRVWQKWRALHSKWAKYWMPFSPKTGWKLIQAVMLF